VTARSARHSLVLADDGIVDPIAVEIAARGTRTVALTPAERQLAAARILARGGTPYLISKAAARQRKPPPSCSRPDARTCGPSART
jgi:hypothetical protein